MKRGALEDDVARADPSSGAGVEVRVVKQFDDRVAAITGAGSGIGRALAVDLAGRGAHLALSDIDEAGLAETVARCEGRGVKVTARRVDVADRAEVEAWADEVVADHGRVNLIVNNAGVALTAEVDAMSYDDLEWLMGINFWGVVHGTKAFLPHLKAAGEGHVVNLSSVFGLLSIPTQSAYNAAKFGVRGFTDALRIELDAADCGVSATTIHPGGIRTNIVRNARLGPGAGGLPDDRDEAARDFDRDRPHHPREGGPPDPAGRAAQPPPGADRPRRQGARPGVAPARRPLPASPGPRRPPASLTPPQPHRPPASPTR